MNSDAKSYQIFEHWSILVAQWLFLSLCMKDHESGLIEMTVLVLASAVNS